MKIPQKLLVIIFCLIAIFSWAPEMRGSPEKSEHPSNKTSDDLRLLKMGKGILGFKIDSTTINEIRNKLGMAEILKGGKHEPNTICYVSSVDQDNTILEFESGLLGDKDILSGFSLYSNKPNHLLSKNCRPSLLVHKNIKTLGSIHLNLDRAFIISILGIPTQEDSNIIKYRHKFEVPWPDHWYTGNNRPVPKEKDYYDVYINISVQFENGKLTVFKISEISSL